MKNYETQPTCAIPFAKMNAIISLIHIFMVRVVTLVLIVVVVVVVLVIMVVDMVIKQISKRYFITITRTIM